MADFESDLVQLATTESTGPLHESDLVQLATTESTGPLHESDLVWWYSGPPLATCKISIDYKMDSVGPEAELVIQRTSDLWYWDKTLNVWRAVFSSVVLPNTITRTTLLAINAIGIYDADDPLIITIQRKTNVLPAYKVFLYRVYLNKNA